MIPSHWVKRKCSGSEDCSWCSFGEPGTEYLCAKHTFALLNPAPTEAQLRDHMRRVMLGLEKVA